MIATLEYDMDEPDDAVRFNEAIAAPKYADFTRWVVGRVRAMKKYENFDAAAQEALEALYQEMWVELAELGLEVVV